MNFPQNSSCIPKQLGYYPSMKTNQTHGKVLGNKSWAYANLEKDSVAGAVERNLAKFGAANLKATLGPMSFPEFYNDSPWWDTYCAACDALRATERRAA